MRIKLASAAVLLICTQVSAQAEPGGFFKNLFSGDAKDTDRPESPGARIYDPSDPYCPPVSVADDGAVLQAYAGAAGDRNRLRHQLIFGRLGRECTLREDGSVGVKVGVEVRALLGPAGAPGRFDAPISVSTRYNGTVLAVRSRRLAVTVPSGAASGSASVVEADLTVPQDKAVGYAITVSLGSTPGKAGPQAGKKPRSPAPAEVTAGAAAE